MVADSKNLLALDIGSKRIGVAIASSIAKLPRPLTTIEVTADSLDDIKQMIDQEHIGAIIIGLPRNLDGQDTDQTRSVQAYGQKIATATGLPIFWQDEALTSKLAEEELKNKDVSYNKGQIDALAATYILSDFLDEHREVESE